jgi:hypothetical protein
VVTAKGVLAESPSLTFCSLTIIGSTLLTAGISRVAVFSVVGSTWAVVFSSVVILAGLFSAFIATATGAGVVDDPCFFLRDCRGSCQYWFGLGLRNNNFSGGLFCRCKKESAIF